MPPTQVKLNLIDFRV